MPFKSKSQLRSCYNNAIPGLDCNKWLHETPNVHCLPERVGDPPKCRVQKKYEKVIGKIITGPKGGKYFTVNEGGYITKVYLSRTKARSRSRSPAKKSPKTRKFKGKGCGCGK